MRKYIVGALFGFLLAFSISAHADTVVTEIQSMIGQIVQGSFPLVIDGTKAEKDVIVVNNTSYVPIRVAGKLFGYDVSFIDSQVILNKTKLSAEAEKLARDNLSTQAKKEEDGMKAIVDKKNADSDKLFNDRNKINVLIISKKSEITDYQNNISRYANGDNEDNKNKFYPNSDFATWYKQFSDKLNIANSELSDLQKQYDDISKKYNDLNGISPIPTPTPTPSP